MDSKIIFRGFHGEQFVEFLSGVVSGSGSSFSVLENGLGEDGESQIHEARC
jgi:hypothetical protein